MSERNIGLWLKDIEEAIHCIISFTSGFDFAKFSESLQVKHAVLHNFSIIGEAVSKLPSEFTAQHSEIPWREIKGFRNYVVHEYFGLDDAIVWDIIQNDLRYFSERIQQLLKSLEE